MIKTQYTYSENQITAICRDGDYLWLGFKANSNAVLYKVSAFDPSVRYFKINIQKSDEITRIKTDGNYIYLTLDSTDYIAARFSKSNPMGSKYYYDIPSGIVEKSVDLAIGSYLYVLIPGDISATNAKILRFNKTGSDYYNTIDLQKSGDIITDARTICFDDSDNLWVATYTDPIKLVKVFGSEYSWDFSTYEIT